MGLAEPRKRLKISHDPNNLAWSQSTESYGQKLLTSQGWNPGQGLGARNAKHIDSSPAQKLAVSYKDNTLGLGASLKTQDLVRTSTGLDAFQGLLGRLNGKSDLDLKKDIQKNEERKLALWAQGRWGGVMFVPGGTLVQGDGYKKADEEPREQLELQEAPASERETAGANMVAQGKMEKKRRKEGKRREREVECGAQTAVSTSEASGIWLSEAESCGGSQESSRIVKKTSSKKKKEKRQPRLTPVIRDDDCAAAYEKEEGDSVNATSDQGLLPKPTTTRTTRDMPRTGRHVIRGRNIEAKRMAISDTRMLDQIFMVRS